jgi:hypothetical protein
MRLSNLLSLVYLALIQHTLAQIDLGTAAPFGIVASTAITNTGATIVSGNLGLSPNKADSITGFPPGLAGNVHAGDAVALHVRQDAQTAYNAAASLPSDSQITGADLGGQILVAGTYTFASSVGLTGTLVLDGQDDPKSLFVFQIGSTLTTATSSSVVLINGAQACNVFFQVGSSATLGVATIFNGNILASTSITLLSGVSVNGGLYALNSAVSLINNRINPQQTCVSSVATIITSSMVYTDIDTSVPTAEATVTTAQSRGPLSNITNDMTTISSEASDMPSMAIPSALSPALDVPDVPTTPNNPDVPNYSDTPSVLGTTSTSFETSITSTKSMSTLYSVLVSTRTAYSTNSTQVISGTYSKPRHTHSNSVKSSGMYCNATTIASTTCASTKTHGYTTTIHGTPCTTLSYYEPTCACTRTTIVPIAYTPAPTFMNVDITTVNGVRALLPSTTKSHAIAFGPRTFHS